MLLGLVETQRLQSRYESIAITPNTFARDIRKALVLFEKATRARRLYRIDNTAYVRIVAELTQAFDAILQDTSCIDLRLRPRGFFFEDNCVLNTPDLEDSIAFAFYRDGIRRLAFLRGVPNKELDVLVTAAASGSSYSRLGEDTVTYLWRHDLQYIQYVVVETTIIDASEAPSTSSSGASDAQSAADLDSAIDNLLQDLYGDARDDVGMTSLSLDRSDLSAKQIASGLEKIDEMAPGFHPLRTYNQTPAYSQNLLNELQHEDDHRLGLRAAHAVLHSARSQESGSLACRRLFEVLLRMYDAAIVEDDHRLATYILMGVRYCPRIAERSAWLSDALAEARLRQASQSVASSKNGELDSLLDFYRACGAAAIGIILSSLASFKSPQNRRKLSDLVVELGVSDPARLVRLLRGEQLELAPDIIYILTQLDTQDTTQLLRNLEYHPVPEVRVALLKHRQPEDSTELAALCSRRLEDEDVSVRIAAAQALAQLGPDAGLLFERRVQAPNFPSEPSAVKKAILEGYILTSPHRSMLFVARLIRRGNRFFVSGQTEDTSIQAVQALRVARGLSRAKSILEKAARGRNRRIRETALSEIKAIGDTP